MSIIEKALEKLEQGERAKRRSEDAANKRTEQARRRATLAAVKAPTGPTAEEKTTRTRDEASLSPALVPGRTARLDLQRLTKAGFVTPDGSRTAIAEQFRIIKRQLLVKAAAVPKGNLILVTSSMAGEGKTYVSTNLALSMAMEMNRTVLLADVDLPKPDVGTVLGIRAREGLMDILSRKDVSLTDVLIKTDLPRLTVLPAGRPHAHAPELLASDAMGVLLEEICERYPDRVVIFDSAPLLADSGASILAGLVGQVLMVVEAVRTPQSALTEALRLLNRTENVSLVLNKSREPRASKYAYGYYGHYGYHGE